MRRREFIGIACGSAFWPLLASAKSASAKPRVVMLSLAPGPAARLDDFRQKLSELGYIEGRNITLEFRSAEGHLDRLPSLAETLVREGNVDVILAQATPTAVAAHNATRTIPIVAIVGVDPVASGLADSLARPGGNVTGVAIFADEANGKRLQLVHELAPGAVRLAVVMANFQVSGELNLATVREISSKLGLVVEIVAVDIDHVSDALKRSTLDRFDAFLFVPDVVLNSRRNEITSLIAQTKKPAVFSEPQWADSGGLVSFGPDTRDNLRHWASLLVRVLKGQQPSDLPFERPTKFDLRINLRTARATGIEIPPTLLARADGVIDE